MSGSPSLSVWLWSRCRRLSFRSWSRRWPLWGRGSWVGGWRGCAPHSGCFRDGQGLPIASETQSISQCLCPEIPGLVRRAVKAELREFPRYEARLTAHLRHGDDVLCDLAVRDISKDGARIARIGPRMAGDPVSLAFPGTDAIASEVERDAEDDFSV